MVLINCLILKNWAEAWLIYNFNIWKILSRNEELNTIRFVQKRQTVKNFWSYRQKYD